MENVVSISGEKTARFSPVEKHQLANQVVAVMDAHFVRPTVEEKLAILETARQHIELAKFQ